MNVGRRVALWKSREGLKLLKIVWLVVSFYNTLILALNNARWRLVYPDRVECVLEVRQNPLRDRAQMFYFLNYVYNPKSMGSLITHRILDYNNIPIEPM